MGKAASKKKTTSVTDDFQQYTAVLDAKQQFVATVLTMSWQLALMVVIPVVAGVKLDERLDSSPSLTLLGFFMAATAACVVVWKTVKQVTELQNEEDIEENKKKRKTRAQ